MFHLSIGERIDSNFTGDDQPSVSTETSDLCLTTIFVSSEFEPCTFDAMVKLRAKLKSFLCLTNSFSEKIR